MSMCSVLVQIPDIQLPAVQVCQDDEANLEGPNVVIGDRRLRLGTTEIAMISLNLDNKRHCFYRMVERVQT